jgi:FkbM family methyltransferase
MYPNSFSKFNFPDKLELASSNLFAKNFSGSKFRTEWLNFDAGGNSILERPAPTHEDFPEWEYILRAIIDASKNDFFQMIDLGAGYGRWSVNAMSAIRNYQGDVNFKPYFLNVEAHPGRFMLLEECCEINEIRGFCKNVNLGISEDGKPLLIAENIESFGASVISNAANVETPEKFIWKDSSGNNYLPIRTVNGSEVIKIGQKYSDTIDIINLDVQGAEYEFLSANISLLSKYVKRIRISTHDKDKDDELYQLLVDHKFAIETFYPRQSTSKTPFGNINTDDGIICCINTSNKFQK